MATRAELRTRLRSRLGLGVVSSIEQVRLNESLNAGLARALSDGAPGLTFDTFVGATLGTKTVTAVTVTLGSNIVTLSGVSVLTDGVFPQDILVVVDGSGTTTKFVIREVLSSTTLDIGSPAAASIAGGSSSSIIRRTVILPNSGQVMRVSRISGSTARALGKVTPSSKMEPFKTGKGIAYDQRYSEGQGKSYVAIWPAPNDATEQYLIEQTEFKVSLDLDADTLTFPEEALDGILERARQAYLTWIGTSDPVQLGAASAATRDVSDSLKNSGVAVQTIQKS